MTELVAHAAADTTNRPVTKDGTTRREEVPPEQRQHHAGVYRWFEDFGYPSTPKIITGCCIMVPPPSERARGVSNPPTPAPAETVARLGEVWSDAASVGTPRLKGEQTPAGALIEN